MNALDIAIDFTARHRARKYPFGLSARQWQVARLLRDGLGSSAIASRLQISASAVRTHRGRLGAKLGAFNPEAVLLRLSMLPGLAMSAGEVVDIDDFRTAFGPSRPAFPVVSFPGPDDRS